MSGMEPREKLLDAQLKGTLDPSKARFSEQERTLRLYTPKLFSEVEDAFRDAPGQGFAVGKKWGDVAYQRGKWTPAIGHTIDSDSIIFRKNGDAWQGEVGDQSIRILEACDQSDAARWIECYLSVVDARSGDPRKTILLLQGVSFVLGEHDDNPTAVAGAGAASVSFFNHHATGRLFCVGVEECTRERRVPTTLMHVLAHESSHLFRQTLAPVVSNLTALVDETILGSQPAGEKLAIFAREINEGYLPYIVTSSCQKARIDEALAEHNRFDVPSARLETSAYVAGEIVAEAFGRYVICGEKPLERISQATQSLLDHLRSITLSPVNLRFTNRDPILTRMLAPVSLEELLANVASGRSMAL